MIVGVPRETYPGERRVALVPSSFPNLAKAGIEVIVEAGAGVAAGFPPMRIRRQGREDLSRIGPRFLQAADIVIQMLCYYGSMTRRGAPICRCFDATRSSSVFLRPMGSLTTVSRNRSGGRNPLFPWN